MGARKGTKPPNAGKGRKKGTPNKVTGELKEMILQALANQGGVAYLEAQATQSPTAFLALVGKVLPLNANLQHETGPTLAGLLTAIAQRRHEG
jgi:hypothetical protein